MHPYLRLELALRRASGPAARGGEAHIPAPLVRRVLGKALVGRFCPFGKPLCEEKPRGGLRPPRPRELCHLAETCPYGVLFAATLPARPPYALHISAPGDDGGAHRLELTLYGAAWRLYPWALTALGEALREGLGKARERWAIEEVRRVGRERRQERLAGR